MPVNEVWFYCVLDKEVFPVCVIGSLTRTGTFWITKIGEAEQEKQRQIQATIRYDWAATWHSCSVLYSVVHDCIKFLNMAKWSLGYVRLQLMLVSIVLQQSVTFWWYQMLVPAMRRYAIICLALYWHFNSSCIENSVSHVV